MEPWHRNRLSLTQAGLVEDWLPNVRLLGDLSWAGADTAVLDVMNNRARYIVKAGGPGNHHLQREMAAHESWVAAWAGKNRAPSLVRADSRQNILLTEYLEGCLVEGTAAEHEPETYFQAGVLLRSFHDQSVRTDDGYEAAATAKALSWLETPHRIQKSLAEEAKAVLEALPSRSVAVVPTHGDWQPRNWLWSGTELRVIDFGRFGFRPATSDFCRLAVQQWRHRPHLEKAFFQGYGGDSRDVELWNVALLREAVSTAAWAYQAGDPAFEQQGHRMLAEALARY